MKNIIVKLIKLYRLVFSPLLVRLFGQGCRFQPTCSEYAIDAIQKYGVFKGTRLALGRFARCHPLSKGGFDPIPQT